jgi:hypothetical protein
VTWGALNGDGCCGWLSAQPRSGLTGQPHADGFSSGSGRPHRRFNLYMPFIDTQTTFYGLSQCLSEFCLTPKNKSLGCPFDQGQCAPLHCSQMNKFIFHFTLSKNAYSKMVETIRRRLICISLITIFANSSDFAVTPAMATKMSNHFRAI